MDNEEENTTTSIHYEKDKYLASYLLTCKKLQFLGTEVTNNIVYFKFAPYQTAKDLVNLYYSRTATPVQPKDILDNLERFRFEVFSIKKGNDHE